jgi:hypothetical protein
MSDPQTPNNNSPSTTPNNVLDSDNYLAVRDHQRGYLVVVANQVIRVCLDEARRYFEMGYEIRDPVTGQRVDIGAVPVPSYASSDTAFAHHVAEIEAARNKLANSPQGGQGRLQPPLPRYTLFTLCEAREMQVRSSRVALQMAKAMQLILATVREAS